jgi:hypothetical protein
MSLFPSLNNNNNKSSDSNKDNILFSARVKDILLSNEQKIFQKIGGWASLGTIQFKPLFGTIDSNTLTSLYAKPLFSNIKQYPVKEEIVIILSAPSQNINDNSNAQDFYYIPFPVGIWNSNHHNSFPDIEKFNSDPKDLEQGKVFKEKEGIKNLLPEEGDIIFEGRFGQSVRMSSTNNKKLNKNPWSDVGNDGDPIIIIRNGQIQTNSSPWTPVYEDINGDDSSIYMTSTQEIPLELSCKNLKSYDITLSDSFNSSLQIPDANLF